ncbi:MAG: hypothetical protein KY476_11590 [Planctomycetes bacterium]|nr:hypothetical protein [Planctomycetota bacterium]
MAPGALCLVVLTGLLQSAVAVRAVAEETVSVRRALIFCGHPGDAVHRTQFAETVTELTQGLVENCGFDAKAVTVLFGTEDMQSDGGDLPNAAAGPCTLERMRSAVEELRAVLEAEDALWVVVIGHSYFDGRRSWFNIPGPDLHEEEFAALFKDVECREMVFWITTPASGFYIRPLASAGRVVVTATEADREINETTFPHALADLLHQPPAKEALDLDRDGDLSLLDLYLAVSKRVAEAYAEENALPTEHAQLEDNGDGRGTEPQVDYLPEELGGRGGEPPPKRPESLDGGRAQRMALSLSPDDDGPVAAPVPREPQ